MKSKKTLFLAFALLWPVAAFSGTVIYKSTNKIDLVKLDSAKKAEKEGGLNHPYDFDADQLRAILSSVHFNKKVLFIKDIEDRGLFAPENVEFLTPYLKEAFQKASKEEVVVASYFTRDTKLVVQSDRLTIFRAYVKEDGLHIKFTKLYAKLLGDRVTKGANRATAEARGMRVALELQPGQDRISWDPEELVFDLNYFKAGGAVATKEEGKPAKKEKAEPSSDKILSVRERLKALDQMRKDEMVSEKEYQKKRKEILREL